MPRFPAMQAWLPFAREDVDFLGDADDALTLNTIWRGKIYLPTMDDHTPHAARVSIALNDGRRIALGFLTTLIGLDELAVRKKAVAVSLPEETASLFVMHPLHCLASRLYNTYGILNRRNNADGTHQCERVHLAVNVVRQMLTEKITASSEGQRPTALIEELAALTLTQAAKKAFCLDNINTMDALPDRLVLSHLGENFLSKPLPQIQKQTADKRKRYMAVIEKQLATPSPAKQQSSLSPGIDDASWQRANECYEG